MKKTLIITMLFGFVFLVWCTQNDNNQNTNNNNDNTNKNQIKTYTMAQVQQHDNEQDCWIVLDGKVYDMTEWIPTHPGWAAILQWCGKDGTDLYENRPMWSGTPHSEWARDLLPQYYIWDLAK